MWLIKGAILVLTLVVWSAVGLVFWIPLLARSTALFSAGILLAALARRDARAYGRQLEAAIVFYSNGFRNTIDALTAESMEDREAGDLSVPIGRLLENLYGRPCSGWEFCSPWKTWDWDPGFCTKLSAN